MPSSLLVSLPPLIFDTDCASEAHFLVVLHFLGAAFQGPPPKQVLSDASSLPAFQDGRSRGVPPVAGPTEKEIPMVEYGWRSFGFLWYWTVNPLAVVKQDIDAAAASGGNILVASLCS